MKGTAELHGLRRSVWQRGFVNASPWPGPRVVTQQAGPADTFVLDSGWGKHEISEVSHKIIRQDNPEAVLDELGHFLAEESGMLGSGGVAPSADAFVFLFESPWFGRGLNRHTVISPLRK